MRLLVKILCVAIASMVLACEDINNCDEYYEKDPLSKVLLPADSLSLLEIRPLNFGRVKMRTVSHEYISIKNNSASDIIKIYSIESKDTKGLYTYTYPEGLPFEIQPGEDIQITEKILVRFIADAFNTGFYYDTLVINNNEDFSVLLSAEVRY